MPSELAMKKMRFLIMEDDLVRVKREKKMSISLTKYVMEASKQGNLSRASELERENSELSRRIESLIRSKSKAQQKSEILQSRLEELQARLTARRINGNESSGETDILPPIHTPRQKTEFNYPSKQPCGILETQLSAALPDSEEKLKTKFVKNGFTKHLGPQSNMVEKLLRRHEKIMQTDGSADRVLSAVKSDRLWFKKKSSAILTNSSTLEGEYDLDGRLLSNVDSNDPSFYSHCSISNLVHLQQQALSTKLMEISESSRKKVCESMAIEIEKSYPKRGQVADKIAERVDAEINAAVMNNLEFSEPYATDEEADPTE